MALNMINICCRYIGLANALSPSLYVLCCSILDTVTRQLVIFGIGRLSGVIGRTRACPQHWSVFF